MSRPGATPYAARGRRRPRVVRWVFLALLIIPIVEIAAIIAVGRVIGGWPTLALLVLESMLGPSGEWPGGPGPSATPRSGRPDVVEGEVVQGRVVDSDDT